MVHDVDDVTVWCPDEEPAHTPCLCGYRVHDLVAEFLGFFVSNFEVIRVAGDDRIFGCGCVARYELDVRLGVGRGVPGHPSHVELLGTEPEIAGVEALRSLNVSHSNVGHNACGAHGTSCRKRMCMMTARKVKRVRLARSGDGCSLVAAVTR